MADRERVAILGGGMSAIVAAYELTRPELDGRYDVTVYQLGWRLGGKCASGRNARRGQRIEEHGLHIWFGFYENAFRVMRDAYEELGRDPEAPLATWRDAFKPCDDIVLYEHYADRWRGWSFEVPRNPLTPGDGTELPQFWEVAHAMLDFLLARWGALQAAKLRPASAAPTAWLPFGLDRLTFGLDRLAADIVGALLRFGRSAPEEALVMALHLAERRRAAPLEGARERTDRDLLWRAIDDFKRWLWKDVVAPHANDDDLRFFFTMFDAGTTILQGIVADELVERGFDTVNDEDLREWLRRHGAQPITLGEGPFVRALYDMAFAYEDGDIRKPNMAAGAAVHDMLRLFFTYRGAFAWKMQAGMGDTVFTPFYEVLKRRGVKFEFFHWVSRLGLSADPRSPRLVEEIEVIEQVALRDGPYRPLVRVNDLDCWPSEPDWQQIVGGEKLRKREVNLEWEPNPLGHKPKILRRGKDFDTVVLGIPVAGLAPICAELIEDRANPGFRAMLEHSRTVMTQAFQLWLNRPLDRLGWSFRDNSIMTGYVEPLDTYANMSQLLPREAWPPQERVENIAYFCGVLEDRPGDTQDRTTKRTRANAIAYLRRHASGIWPGAAGRRGAGFEWSYLVDEQRRSGDARFDDQFWRANFQPTERYVLTTKGSVKYRLGADESGYENLVLAGDWTKTGFDAGCVEAAVMSGMQASRAISGSPATVFGEDQTWLGGAGTQAPPATERQLAATLPAYVNYGGLATAPSPVACEGATLYSFFLEGDHDRLAELCDRVFGQPSGGAVQLRPLGHHVMLTFGIVEKIEPQREPWSQMGYATERQVAFWVPVIAVERRGDREVAVSLAWFVPYMWVDNPLSLAGGREIYGYNKNWGWIGLPANGAVDRLTLAAYGGDYGKGRPSGRHPLIEVSRAAAGEVKRGGARWGGLGELVDDARGVLRKLHADSPLELPDAIFEDIMRRGGPPQIFLKQFRSVSDGERASEQQITDGTVTVNRISGRPLLSEFQFKLHHLDSHPVAAELGVADQATRLAFEIEMDFVLEDGRVLWQAPAR
jgi:uncharacterized protein with NAD-binding domain and iron-sulfur cluster